MATPTSDFIRKMEARRLSKESPNVLDMRGKAPGRCRPFDYKGRTFHVDDISLNILKRGLEKTGGVFTVGLYEAIINGPHTNRARDSRERQNRTQAAQSAGQPAGESSYTEELDDHRGVIEFGYFRRRKEPRLNFAVEVSVTDDRFDFGAVTKNLSPSGLCILVRAAYRFEVGKVLKVDFSGLGVQSGALDLTAIRYQLVKVIFEGDRQELMLRRMPYEGDEPLGAFIEDFIERGRGKYKLDIADELQSKSALLYERMFTEHSTEVPLFISREADGGYFLNTVFASRHSHPLIGFFKQGDRYDFLPLGLPHRLQRLHQDKCMRLVMFKSYEKGIRSCAEFEMPDKLAWQYAVNKILDKYDGIVISINARVLTEDDRDKNVAYLEELLKRTDEQVPDLSRHIQDQVMVANVVDITAQYRELCSGERGSDLPAAVQGQLGYYGGMERYALADDRVLERLTVARPAEPKVSTVGYIWKRSEERYVARTALELIHNDVTYQGFSVNLSVGGMKLEVDQDLSIKEGDTAYVHLVSLQKKRRYLDLTKIEYEVVGLVKENGLNTVMLKRIIDSRNDLLQEFFVGLIRSNREKLTVDSVDVQSVSSSQIHGSISAASLVGIPFFMTMSDQGTPVIRDFAVNTPANELASLFWTDEAGYDFSAFSQTKLVYHLFDGLKRFRSEGRAEACELTCILLRGFGESKAIQCTPVSPSLSTYLDNPQFRRKCRHSAVCRFVKVVIRPITGFSEMEVDKSLLSVFEQSHFKVLQFKELLDRVVGVGEVIDITEDLMSFTALG